MGKNMICCPVCGKLRTTNYEQCPWCKAREEKEKELKRAAEEEKEEMVSPEDVDADLPEDADDSSSVEGADSSQIEAEEGTQVFCHTDTGNTFLMNLSSEWGIAITDNMQLLSSKNEKALYNFLTDIQALETYVPSIYDTIVQRAEEEHFLVAKLDEYTQKLVEKGDLWYSVDKNGEILPTVRDKTGIVKQVRLEEKVFRQPSNGIDPQMISNMHTQLMLAKILEKVDEIKVMVQSLNVDLQEDRIAKVQSVLSSYNQALAIEGPRREERMQLVGMSATEAKTLLMRNLHNRLGYIIGNIHKGFMGRVQDNEGDSLLEQNANDVMNDLVGITQMVDIECTVHRYFGDGKAIDYCLGEFTDFITENKLDQRDTLVKVAECLSYSGIQFISGFSKLVSDIHYFQDGQLIEQKEFKQKMLPSLIPPKSAFFCRKCKKELSPANKSGLCEYCRRMKYKKRKKIATGVASVAAGLVGAVGAAGGIVSGVNSIDDFKS